MVEHEWPRRSDAVGGTVPPLGSGQVDEFERRRYGVWSVLQNGPFRRLWLVELLTQTVQNAVWYMALVLVERATKSTTLLSVTVVTAVLPAALFGMLAGALVDRWPKRPVLIGANLVRAAIVPFYLLPGATIVPVLVANFLMNAAAQFFYPAELAMIPHVLRKARLTAAMGLFNVTWTVAQFLGLVLLGPLLLKALGAQAGAVAIVIAGTVAYAVSGGLMALLPPDTVDDVARRARASARGGGAPGQILGELREGLHSLHRHTPARLAILYLALTTTLLLVVATLAPRYAVRELHIGAADAISLIAPAGVAMAVASSLAPGLVRRFGRERVIQRGLLVMVGALVLLALVGPVQRWFLLHGLVASADLRGWHLLASRIGVVMLLAALLGWQMGLVMVPAQAIVAEWAPERLRGRIFSIQLTLTNLAAIVPLLILGGLADLVGIPAVLLLIALVVLVLWYHALRRHEAPRPRANGGD